MDEFRKYRLSTPEKKDLESDLRALNIPKYHYNAVIGVSQKHLQRALDRRQPLWRKVWHWVRGDA